MKRTLFLICSLLLLVLGLQAQKLTVESMTVATNDISASTSRRMDLNGQPCGLVKVQLATSGAVFDGNIIKPVEYKTGEYWVYMTDGAYMLQIKHPNFLPLELNFRDYGIKKVQSLTAYKLVITMPQVLPGPVDDGNRYLALTVVPANSRVEIDGKGQLLEADGTAMILLAQGSHSYVVTAPGYADERGTVVIGTEKVVKDIRLQSVLTQVQVSCPTAGAQIYVNEQLKGGSPWSGQLMAGNYQFEARLAGHRPSRVSETLGERANRQIAIPALVPITGNLDVSYKPMNAEVWLDGKKLGTSPDVFRGIMIGSHEVEIRKDGYQTKKETVTISEGQTASLSGELKASASNSAFASTSSGGNIETITLSNGVSFNMIRVDGGTFTMGATSEQGSDADSDEKPTHRVTLSSYYIGETEVTQALWEAVMGSNPSNWKGPNLPVESVSWDDCQEFIRRLNRETGKSFRLPTEAEWEYAARGGQKSKGYKYSGSNTIGDVAWYTDNSGSKTHSVKTRQANELGVYDMSGNVWEWCEDWYGSYSSSSQTNPTGPSKASRRVNRGGSWDLHARYCRVSNRNSRTPSFRIAYLGLRLAL